MTRAQELMDRAREGETVCGTVISSSDPVLAERMASGFDFVWIDLEHSALSVRDVQTLAIAAHAGGCAALVRLPSSNSELLTAVLDAGLDGIVAPRVDDAAQAHRFVSGLSYPPGGWRGFAPRRGNGFGKASAESGAGPRVISIVQIETRKGLANVEEIAAVPGLDWLLVGISDLSFELGAPLQPQAPEVLAAVERVRAAAAAAGVRFGLAASGDEQALLEVLRMPLDMLLYSSDARIYAGAIAAAQELTASAARRARDQRAQTAA
jgi:2-keto-3-deoxy-L-rhamnonate aldolase RhmA